MQAIMLLIQITNFLFPSCYKYFHTVLYHNLQSEIYNGYCTSCVENDTFSRDHCDGLKIIV